MSYIISILTRKRKDSGQTDSYLLAITITIHEVFEKHLSHQDILEFIEYLAVAVAFEVTLLDPEYIILGGGVIQMSNFPRQLFEDRIRDRTRKPFPSQNLRFIYADNAQDNGVIGAGIHAYKMIESNN